MRLLRIIILVGVIILSLSLAIYTVGSDKQPYIVELGDQSIEGEFYDAIVLFRNDDVKEMSEQFEEVNNVFMEHEIPVSHAIVPQWFQNQNNDFDKSCEEFQELKDNNPELVEYSAHGYSHDGHEFRESDWNTVNKKLDKIDTFFNDCLNHQPKVFIPPQNGLSTTSRILINESGYSVISADRRSKWQENQAKITADRQEIVQDRPLDLGQSQMLVEYWHTEPVTFRNMTEVKSSFDESVEENQIHVQTIHYSPLTSTDNIDKLEELVQYMQDENVYFSSFKEISSLFEKDKVHSVEDGWIIQK